MGAGRPREHDRNQIAADLLEWSTNPTAFNLIQFTRPRLLNVNMLPNWAAEDDEFREALELAKQSIAMNRFEAAIEGALPFSEVHRNEADYDPLRDRFQQREKRFDLELEKEKLDHAHKLKKEENKELSNIDAERYSNAIKAKSLIKECG